MSVSPAKAMQPIATSSSTFDPDAQPYFGVVENTVQALRLVFAAWLGVVPRIVRRLNDTERKEKIVSGAVFVFGVEESGMRRWTDGRLWSPSRIDGNFLVYREMNRKGDSLRKFDHFEEWIPGDNGRAILSSLREQRQGRSCHPSGSSAESGMANGFKSGGLVKKTITVKINGLDHHLICYYTQQDIYMRRFKPMSTRSDIMSLDLPPHIFCFSDFRVPPRLERGPDGLPNILCEPERRVPLVALPNDSIGKFPSDWPDRVNGVISLSHRESAGTCIIPSATHGPQQMPSIGLGESWQEPSDSIQIALLSNSQWPHWASLAALSVGQLEYRHASQTLTHVSASQYQSQYQPQGWPSTHGYHASQHASSAMASNTSNIYHPLSQSRDTDRVQSSDQSFGARGMSDGGTRHIGKEGPVWLSAASDVCHIADSRFPMQNFFPLTGHQSIDNTWSSSEYTLFETEHPSFAAASQSTGQDPSVCI